MIWREIGCQRLTRLVSCLHPARYYSASVCHISSSSHRRLLEANTVLGEEERFRRRKMTPPHTAIATLLRNYLRLLRLHPERMLCTNDSGYRSCCRDYVRWRLYWVWSERLKGQRGGGGGRYQTRDCSRTVAGGCMSFVDLGNVALGIACGAIFRLALQFPVLH